MGNVHLWSTKTAYISPVYRKDVLEDPHNNNKAKKLKSKTLNIGPT